MLLKPSNIKRFQQYILSWYDQHGRKNLPWQQPATPYRVWISEIMLQQTQVATVIPYFKRFIKKFADVKSLADAPLDDVLTLWSGLGYYARARNLHRAAQLIMKHYQGKLPQDLRELQQLPGIGRSTAGAILALGWQKPAAILDGNVKRVFARFHAIAGYPGTKQVSDQLWELVESYVPTQRANDYTQALMDLGALICTRSNPQCSACPLHKNCTAYQQGEPTRYPTPAQRKVLPQQTAHLLLLQNQAGQILLEKRPPTGIWGGLWSLPLCAEEENFERWCIQQYGYKITQYQHLTPFHHTFSHFRLNLLPVLAKVVIKNQQIMETPARVWYNVPHVKRLALAAPIKRVLECLK